MKVNVKENREIPPGYTYTRCDTYTAEGLIAACSMYDDDGFLHIGWRCPYAEAYVKANPKAAYTTEDKIAILKMKAQNVNLAELDDKKRGKRRRAAISIQQRREV